jgi:3-hydroxyacyl-CoA dehydrogenase/enoyl-CoA hydratase/3-hydroxybutyryl-CoA epimerase
LAALRFPTIAWISGFCLGGGLELALACQYRVAEDSPKTRLGLPEVMLGIHPGWGGTVRLPLLIGTLAAMDFILTGRAVPAKVAYKLGLVDACVPKRQALTAVLHYANLKKHTLAVNRQGSKIARAIDTVINWSAVRPWIGKIFYKQLNKKIKQEHYPAPYAAVDNWVEVGIHNEDALSTEAHSIIQLTTSDTAKNLVRVFHLRERLKNFGQAPLFKPTYVHVVGAGVMGGDIAAWCALKGYQVTLQDPNVKAIAASLKRAQNLFFKHLKEPYLVRAAMDRLLPDVHGTGIPRSDIIIEAIIEKPEAKQALFRQLEALAKPNAVFATNTSTILMENIACALQDRTRFVGLHFFNPVPKMPLVEVIASDKTDPLVLQEAMAFIRTLDKLSLPVKSSPGFLVNRLLMPYLVEAMRLLDQGYSKCFIDKAAVDFGMPLGPLELIDTIGLDVCLLAGDSLKTHFGGEVPEIMKRMVAEGHLGKKSGQGFYHYHHGKKVKKAMGTEEGEAIKNVQEAQVAMDIVDRLIDKIILEAKACLEEGVVSDADLVDAGMIFGAGFPPFRGGPMVYHAVEVE